MTTTSPLIIETSPAARLIVCERTGRWAVALRRELAGSGVRVWETRTLADCRGELSKSAASFAVVELGIGKRISGGLSQFSFDENGTVPFGSATVIDLPVLGRHVAGLLRFLARQPREFPAVRLAVAADRELAGFEWLLREAGAVDFLCSPRQVGRLARAACRHLAQVSPPPQSLSERIWAGLPWG